MSHFVEVVTFDICILSLSVEVNLSQAKNPLLSGEGARLTLGASKYEFQENSVHTQVRSYKVYYFANRFVPSLGSSRNSLWTSKYS